MEKNILELKDSTDIISFFDKVSIVKKLLVKKLFCTIDNFFLSLNLVLSKPFEF